MDKAVYDKNFLNSIQPSNELEEDVLRRAILPDGFDDIPGLIRELQPIHRRLLVTGGRLVLDDGWCDKVVVHYELRERVTAGWYVLRVSFWHRQTAADLGGFTLRAGLWTFPPLVQAPWLGHKRRFHCHPIWGIPLNRDLQVSNNVLLSQELPPPEATLLLAVSSVKRYETFEWNPIVPHIRLTDVSRFTAT